MTQQQDCQLAICSLLRTRLALSQSEEEPLALFGAKSKRTGLPCKQPTMKNGRRRLHGGKSTGPKTKKGLFKVKKLKTKHSYYSKEAIEERKNIRNLISKSKKHLFNF